MCKTKTQVFPDLLVGNLLCLQKSLCDFYGFLNLKTKRENKKERKFNKKKRGEKKEIKKSSKKKRDIDESMNVHLFK